MDGFTSLFDLAGESIIAHVISVSYDGSMDEIENSQDVEIDNVLFGSPTAEDIANSERIHGARAAYKLCIPRKCQIGLSGASITRVSDGTEWLVITDGPQLPLELTPTQWNREVLIAREVG